jgi:YidC/Oxa1 family membrane protein insertase
LTTNVISLVQVGFLRIPKVRSHFNIDPIVVVPPVKGAGPKKGFLEGMKEGKLSLIGLLEIFKCFSLFL